MNTATNYDLKIKKRIQLVHIAKQELRMSEEDYRLILKNQFKVKSSKELGFHRLGELLIFMQGLGFKVKTAPHRTSPTRGEATAAPKAKPAWKKYESSIQGLKDEITDLAKARWGEGWETPLNSLCQRFGVRHWKWLDVAHGKEIKKAIQRMQSAERMGQSAEASMIDSMHEALSAAAEEDVPF